MTGRSPAVSSGARWTRWSRPSMGWPNARRRMGSAATKTAARRVRFGEVATCVNDRVANPREAGVDRYVGLERLDSESLRIRRWGAPTDVEATKLLFRKGDIIFGRRRAYQRKLAVADFDGICSAHAMVLRVRPEIVLPEFLPFFMQSDVFMERALAISVGSLSPTINWKTLAQEEFVLPPLEEQRRLARLLSAAARVTEELSMAKESHKLLHQALVDSLPSVPTSRGCRLGDVAQMQNGRPFPSAQYQTDGMPLLRPGNLAGDGYFTWNHAKTVFMPPEWENTARDFVVEDGDVVINLTAQSLEDGFMGRVCLARRVDRCLLNQRIGRFRVQSDALLPEFLFRVLQSSRFQRHCISMCEGTKVKHLFWNHLERC